MIAGNPVESVELRQAAAIALEEYDMSSLDELDGFDAPPVSSGVVREVQRSLRRLFLDAGAPTDVRRTALEASVRASEAWHEGAVRGALESDDRPWRLTGVFCAQYIRGFDQQILEALESDDPGIELEAVRAAGACGLRDAWPHVAAIFRESQDKDLRLAAIEAAPSIDPEAASPLLADIADSEEAEEDEDIRDAVQEALGMCGRTSSRTKTTSLRTD